MAEAPRRKLWLDWQRGLAVLYMVQWHSWDSWRADAAAVGRVHDAMAVIGGFAAPSFLYMAGMSLLLGDAAQERKGVPVGLRRTGAVRRALWLLGVAYLFRVFEYVAGGGFWVPDGWQSILKVDVLNVIAVSLLATAVLTIGVPPRWQVSVAVAAAAAVALLSPVVAGWQHAPNRVLDYLYSEWPRGIFYLFPWAAFCMAGNAVGRLASGKDRPALWLGIGAALIAGGWGSAQLPSFYAHQDFWRTSPSWLAMRLGIVVVMSGALQLVPASADRWLTWLRTMGRHSMLGYFVSIELPYGALSSVLHKKLGTAAALVGVVSMIVVTWLASELAERYDVWSANRARARAARPVPAA
jgi:uncharacterized membrane protein